MYERVAVEVILKFTSAFLRSTLMTSEVQQAVIGCFLVNLYSQSVSLYKAGSYKRAPYKLNVPFKPSNEFFPGNDPP